MFVLALLLIVLPISSWRNLPSDCSLKSAVCWRQTLRSVRCLSCSTFFSSKPEKVCASGLLAKPSSSPSVRSMCDLFNIVQLQAKSARCLSYLPFLCSEHEDVCAVCLLVEHSSSPSPKSVCYLILSNVFSSLV
jgi:hypothetical protein